jgi:hypothetical protein
MIIGVQVLCELLPFSVHLSECFETEAGVKLATCKQNILVKRTKELLGALRILGFVALHCNINFIKCHFDFVVAISWR